MQASKRNAGVPSAMVARQSLNDEELVSKKLLDLLIRELVKEEYLKILG